MRKVRLYLFNWQQGGYNTVFATSKKEAILLGQAKAGPNAVITIDPKSVRLPKKGEVEKLDQHYSGMFD